MCALVGGDGSVKKEHNYWASVESNIGGGVLGRGSALVRATSLEDGQTRTCFTHASHSGGGKGVGGDTEANTEANDRPGIAVDRSGTVTNPSTQCALVSVGNPLSFSRVLDWPTVNSLAGGMGAPDVRTLLPTFKARYAAHGVVDAKNKKVVVGFDVSFPVQTDQSIDSYSLKVSSETVCAKLAAGCFSPSEWKSVGDAFSKCTRVKDCLVQALSPTFKKLSPWASQKDLCTTEATMVKRSSPSSSSASSPLKTVSFSFVAGVCRARQFSVRLSVRNKGGESRTRWFTASSVVHRPTDDNDSDSDSDKNVDEKDTKAFRADPNFAKDEQLFVVDNIDSVSAPDMPTAVKFGTNVQNLKSGFWTGHLSFTIKTPLKFHVTHIKYGIEFKDGTFWHEITDSDSNQHEVKPLKPGAKQPPHTPGFTSELKTPGQSAFSVTISGLRTGGNNRVKLRACNEVACSAWSDWTDPVADIPKNREAVAGAHCTENSVSSRECAAPGVCWKGKCQANAKKIGTQCWVGKECASKLCQKDLSEFTSMSRTKSTCLNDAKNGNGDVGQGGAVCKHAVECKSSRCLTNGRCAAPSQDVGRECLVAGECKSGRCEAEELSMLGSCRGDGKCRCLSKRHGGGKGAFCKYEDDCVSGTCSSSSSAAGVRASGCASDVLALGDQCEKNENCATRNCVNSRCAPTPGKGKANAFCNKDTQCAPVADCATKCRRLSSLKPNHPDVANGRCLATCDARKHGKCTIRRGVGACNGGVRGDSCGHWRDCGDEKKSVGGSGATKNKGGVLDCFEKRCLLVEQHDSPAEGDMCLEEEECVNLKKDGRATCMACDESRCRVSRYLWCRGSGGRR
jgi:hypothetical protein